MAIRIEKVMSLEYPDPMIRIWVHDSFLIDGETGKPVQWSDRDILYGAFSRNFGAMAELKREIESVAAACERFWGDQTKGKN